MVRHVARDAIARAHGPEVHGARLPRLETGVRRYTRQLPQVCLLSMTCDHAAMAFGFLRNV
jgi:hypothetical protein